MEVTGRFHEWCERLCIPSTSGALHSFSEHLVTNMIPRTIYEVYI